MQMLPLTLEYLIEVAQAGSVTAAAERLGVATSAVSRQIGKLERSVGVALFERHARGMSLTAAGARLVARARATDAELGALVDALREERGGRRRPVAVACTHGFSMRLVPRAMAALRHVDPGITFTLSVLTASEVTSQVTSGAADVGVTFALGVPDGIHVQCALEVPVVALVPERHPLADRERLTLAEVAREPLALPPPGTTQRELIEVGAQLERLSLHPVLTCDELAPLYEFVRAGGGIAFAGDLGPEATAPCLEVGIVKVPLEHPVFSRRQAQVQVMDHRTLPVEVRSFCDLLTASLRSR